MKKRKAFTLLEMVLAFIIFGVIVMVVCINARPAVKRNTDSMLSYSAYMTLKKGVGDYIAKHGMIKSSTDLCSSIVALSNVVGVVNCNTLWSDYADTPNFTLANGMKIYNMGSTYLDDDSHTVSNLLTSIAEAEEELATLKSAEPFNMSAYNEKLEDINTKKETLSNWGSYYTIYVDLDGEKGKREKENDVVTFLISLYGEVVPYGVLADTKDYMVAEYRYYDGNNWVWGITDETKKTFKYAICKGGNKVHIKNYCTGITVDSHCSKAPCDLVIRH